MSAKLIYLTFAMLIFSVSCVDRSEKILAVDWESRLKTKVAPFVVEHYELITVPDSALVLHFNRAIELKENAFIYIHTIIGSIHYGEKPLVPIRTKNRKFILKLPLPDSLSNRKEQDGLTTNGKMMRMLRANWNTPGSIDLIEFSSTMGLMMPKIRFVNGKMSSFPLQKDFLGFSQKVDTSDNYNNPGNEWRRVLLKKYQGKFDNKGLKQGEWKWFYSNGSLLGSAVFKNDSLTDNLLIFDFHGNCIDTIPTHVKDIEHK